MENKFFKILKTLSHKEFKEFGNFLKSPYFNSSDKYVMFYEFLECHFPHFKDNLDKGKLFNAFYPGEKYSDKKLRDRLTHSLNLLKDFISINHIKKNEFELKKNLLVGIIDKDSSNIFEDEHKNLTLQVESSKIKDEEYYYKKYLLSSIYRSYFETRTSVSEKASIYTKTSDEIDYMINFFLIVMIKEYSKMFNSAREVKLDYKFKFYEQIVNFILKDEASFEKVPLINLLFKFTSLYNLDKDEIYIKNLMELLNTHKNEISRDVYEILNIELYNYCKRMESHGKKEFGKISFELMKQMLNKNIFFESDGFMTAHTYINITATAIRENEIDWAESFINYYKDKVKKNERLNAYNYNLAVLYYIKGYNNQQNIKEMNYQMALTKLSEVKSKDFYYATRIKNHELKIYYELDFTENLFSLLDSYNHYLIRNKLIPDHLKDRYLNFVKFTDKLTRLKLKKGILFKEKLKKQIELEQNIEYKGWLLQRLQEIS